MLFFKLLFLFMIGSIGGWCLELVYRRIFSAKKWINPGFLVGPYLPIYGSGVVLMYVMTEAISPLNFPNEIVKSIVIIIILGLTMTLIEYITGLIFIKGMHIKLWDYSDQPLNIQGIICPLFSLIWLCVCALYYLFIHKYVVSLALAFDNLEYVLFFVGMYAGILLIDIIYSFNLASKIRKAAKESKILVRYEQLKKNIAEDILALSKKRSFLFPFKSPYELNEQIKRHLEQAKEIIKKRKTK